MKIAIDALPLSSGHRFRGMGMYTRNLIDSLIIESKNSRDITIDAFDFLNNKDKLKNFDLLHYPYFDLFKTSLPLYSSKPFVVTVPDVIPLIYPKHYPPGVKGRVKYAYQKIALSRAAGVITISEASKKDVVRFLNISQQKIFVTYLAPNFKIAKVSTIQKQKIAKKYNIPHNFVLYLGDVNWNKNVVRLIEAIKKTDQTLVIVGKQAVSVDYDKSHIENAPILEIQNKYSNDSQVLRLGYVQNDDLNVIWQMATLYCQPSLYEGFGLPLLEAFDAGVPVIASKTQALVEVGEDACEYFDPYDVVGLSRKISSLVQNSAERNKLLTKGKARVKDFSWRNTAKETLAAYKLALA